MKNAFCRYQPTDHTYTKHNYPIVYEMQVSEAPLCAFLSDYVTKLYYTHSFSRLVLFNGYFILMQKPLYAT